MYNPLERKVASFLNQFPQLKQRLKILYQYGNYLIFSDRDFTVEIHPNASLLSPSKHFNTGPHLKDFFYGYYDTTPWNNQMDCAIYHARTSENSLAIALFTGDGYREIATTHAWNYQQGSRLQWHPQNEHNVLFNDVKNGTLISRVVDITGQKVNQYNRPIQALSPQGDEFISLNYNRLDSNRPGYGYGLGNKQFPSPSEDGLWRVNLSDGSSELLIPLSDLIHNDLNQKNHYLNHVLYNPSGDQFVFLHRWHGDHGRRSRLYLSDRADSPLLDWQIISHYSWLSDERLLIWGLSKKYGNGYFTLNIATDDVSRFGAFETYGDGHPSVSPDDRWVVTDTYPDRSRQRHLILYDRRKDEEIQLGRFFAPFEFDGLARCDLHPRWSPDGTAISVDSVHDGTRKSYIIDVENIVEC